MTDRRARRRAETQAEILDLALEVMAEDGVAGLSLSTVARRLGIQPPSLYKYFPSRHAVYDALFERGQEQYLQAVRQAATGLAGLRALGASMEAGARWIMANQVLAQLLFWRPVPGFQPSPEAYAPALAIHEHFATVIRGAVRLGELHPDAASEEGLALAASLIAGPVSQQLANQPAVSYEEGLFTRLVPRLPGLLAAAYPPR
ncbi:TetR/AcrR family transcriptional regulator [Nonomuraea sediminis]|uniref:TetR/AcrR family transcriptional regulator n=1 Tax=Nonomuraea sediminis TaxID=2835864 RepID=UPI001BDD14CC|nr:TetR/AcrR family transcriptional regulator [Nonomuraea sediminis]